MRTTRYDVPGVLPLGIEVDGVVHTAFVVGPITVLASIEADAEAAAERPDEVDEAQFRVLCRLGRAIRSIGPVQRPLNGVALLDAFEEDVNTLLAASKEVDTKVASFRSPAASVGAGGQDNGLGGGGSVGDA